jgi:hypothetical protein
MGAGAVGGGKYSGVGGGAINSGVGGGWVGAAGTRDLEVNAGADGGGM